MSQGRPRILLPVRVMEGQVPPAGLVDLLGGARVLVLGYMVLPEQTAPGQAREQFEQEAQQALSRIQAGLLQAGAEAETRLVFTPEPKQTFTRVAEETDADAVVLPQACPPVERVLLPLRSPVNMDRLLWLTAALLRGTDVRVTAFHAGDDAAQTDAAEHMLQDALDQLVGLGLEPAQMELQVEVTEEPVEAIARAGLEHQVIVMGETEPTLGSLLFGTFHEQVDDRFDGPMIVVRKEHGLEPPGGQGDEEGGSER